MKMLFLFSSVTSFNRYYPILKALIEQGYTITTTIVATVDEHASFRAHTVTDEKRQRAWKEVKDLNLDIFFVEQEFAWLGIGHTRREHLLKPDTTLEAISEEIKNYHACHLS